MPYIKITLQSDLCAGSGVSLGNNVDTDICLDAYGLPVIPARRIKGCLREVAALLHSVQPTQMPPEAIERLFGTPSTQQGTLHLQDATLADAPALHAGMANLTAAPKDYLQKLASPAGVSALFTSVRAQTAIDETTGTAKEGSLRFTRVVNQQDPCHKGQPQVFYAPVTLPTQDHATLAMLCQALRHLGMHQTRGLGAVQCSFEQAPMPSALPAPQVQALPTTGTVQLTYHITLTAPMTIAEGEQLGSAIPASALIGCLAGQYLTTATVDAQFHALFHAAGVQFSAITPLVQGNITTQTPLHFVLLKHEGRYANRYAPSFAADQGKKQKTLQGSYAARTAQGEVAIATPRTEVRAHHAFERVAQGKTMQQSTLYTQEALCSAQQYGGTITAPAALAPALVKLLCSTPLRFGRSRTAEYGSCQLTYLDAQSVADEQIQPSGRFYVVLEADMLLSRGGIYTVQHADVRAAICEALHLPPANAAASTAQDWCSYRRIGGFQASWGLRKPEREVLCAGSVLVFEGDGSPLPRTLTLGELQQEGFGKCTLYPAAEFEAECPIVKTKVDTATPVADSNVFAGFAAALLLAQAREQVLLRAHALVQETPLAQRSNSFIGRMRLMLLESGGDSTAFLRSINAIPENTNANKKRKKFANEFFAALFEAHALPTQGGNIADIILAAPDHCAALLQDDALFAALQQTLGSEQAAQAVLPLWYAKAEQLLTLLKYQQRQPKAPTLQAETEVAHA